MIMSLAHQSTRLFSRHRRLLALPINSVSRTQRSSLHAGRIAPHSNPTSNNSGAATGPAASASAPKNKAQPPTATDPHLAAAERIALNKSSERLQATDALNLVSTTVRMKNLATAAALFGFATGVCWYSMNAVGRVDGKSNDGALTELEEAATEARQIRAEQILEDEEMRGLIDGDSDEDNFDEESPSTNKGATGRPLWKKIVFFWKRD